MFLTEIGKCDFLTEMYYYKNNKSRSLCQANTNKKESQISLELFCGAYGTRNQLAALLAKNPDPGSRGEYIQKRRNLAVSSCGAYGTRTRDPLRDRQIF